MGAPICPECRGPMKQRSGTRGSFWGCLAYPSCKGTRPVTETAPSAPSMPTPKTFAPTQSAIPMPPGPTADMVHALRQAAGHLGVAIDLVRKVAPQLDAVLAKDDEVDF